MIHLDWGSERVKCLIQKHHTMSVARAWILTTQSRVQPSNHEATLSATNCSRKGQWYLKFLLLLASLGQSACLSSLFPGFKFFSFKNLVKSIMKTVTEQDLISYYIVFLGNSRSSWVEFSISLIVTRTVFIVFTWRLTKRQL